MPFFNPSPHFEPMENETLTESLSRYIKFREEFDYRTSFIYTLASAVGGSPTLEFRKSIKNAIDLSKKDFDQIPIDLLLTNEDNEQLNALKNELNNNPENSEEEVKKGMDDALNDILKYYRGKDKEVLCYRLLSNYIAGLESNLKLSDSLKKEIESVKKILDVPIIILDPEATIEQVYYQ